MLRLNSSNRLLAAKIAVTKASRGNRVLLWSFTLEQEELDALVYEAAGITGHIHYAKLMHEVESTGGMLAVKHLHGIHSKLIESEMKLDLLVHIN